MMLQIGRAKARRYIPSLSVAFCSAALQGGIGCKQSCHFERVWNLLDEGSAVRRVPDLRIPKVGTALVAQGAPPSLRGPWGICLSYSHRRPK